MIKDPLLRVLFATDFWSTRQLLAECRALSPEQFAQNLGVGRGSLQSTLTHGVDAMFLFADRLDRRPRRMHLSLDGQAYSAVEVTGLFERAAQELEAAVTQAVDNHGLDETLNWTDSDDGQIAPEDQITYAVALAQMVDHGIHHRTQAMEMLRLLGVAGEKPWHPFDWDEAVRLG